MMSAPSSRGFCRYGVMKVLSTMVNIPCLLAISDTAFRSVTNIRGLAGLSTRTATTSSAIAFSKASRSKVSAMVYVIPKLLNTLSRTRNVPP